MRVLFLGTAGVNKKAFVENLAEIASKAQRKVKSFLNVVDLDGEISNFQNGPAGYAAFLDNPLPRERQEIWDSLFKKMVLRPFGTNPRQLPHVFLLLHGVYYRKKDYFSHVNLSLLREFQPSVVVTLIDDAYDVANEINMREKRVATGSYCSFAEALQWRAVEIMTGDMIANYLYLNPSEHRVDIRGLESKARAFFRTSIPHFVVAVKHSPEMLYRLLFERRRLCIYFSHPITTIQVDQSKVNIINKAMMTLSAKYTVFVPDTIDEFPVVKKVGLSRDEIKIIRNLRIEKGRKHFLIRRWPLRLNCKRPVAVLPPSVNLKTFLKLERIVKAHTDGRDRRIIRQGLDAMVAYRPNWGGRPSHGVEAEMSEAAARNIPIFAVHIPKEDGEPETMLRGFAAARCFASLGKLNRQLVKLQQAKIAKMIPDTWELD